MNSSYQCLGECNFLISLHIQTKEMAKMECAFLPFRSPGHAGKGMMKQGKGLCQKHP